MLSRPIETPTVTLPLAASLTLFALSFRAHAESHEPLDLGGHPVCEASAAVLVPCPQVGGRGLLVGDNEDRNHLFVYRVVDEGLDVASRRALPFTHLLDELERDEREISDIEALVLLRGAEVLVVGSHSRNKSCETRKKRRRTLGWRTQCGSSTFNARLWPSTACRTRYTCAMPPPP